MADEPTNQNPETGQPASPPASPPEIQGKPDGSPTAQDVTKMAEELGRLKKVEEDFKSYVERVNPVLETVWADDETLKFITDKHNKRLGVTPSDQPPPEEKPEPSPEVKKVESGVSELRNNEVVGKINAFYSRHEFHKLDQETQKILNEKVGVILMEMLDPGGGKKDLKQVLEDVPLTKLDKFLEDAYFLATKDEQLKAAQEQGQQQASAQSLGIIGSMPSTSPSPDNLTLTVKEREIAQKMGIPEDKFLERKKEIAQRGNRIY